MFVFLTALKHPKTANDYANVKKLLKYTLHSVCSQTNQDFKMIVVCNEKPDIPDVDERVHFLVVDFPPVSKVNGVLDKREKFLDKGSKYFAGLMFAKQFSPDYVYILDSDDWVNVNLIETLHKQPHQKVWYVDKGYFVNLQNAEYKARFGLLRYCGSTFIYDYQYLMSVANISSDVDFNSTQAQMIAATSDFFIVDLLSNHLINFAYYKDKGAIPEPIPLATACWVQGTGENVSRTAGGDDGLPIDQSFIDTFGLPQELMNSRPASPSHKLRHMFTTMKSFLTWHYSRITGKKVFS